MTSNTVTIEVDDSDPRDPNAKCDRCGAVGTIARAVRHTANQLVLRYCGRCWPLATEEREKQQREENEQWHEAERAFMTRSRDDMSTPRPSPPPTWTSSSRSWYDTRRFLTLVQRPGQGGPTATPESFAKIAADIRATQSEMDGPVPPDIKEFLDRYAS